MSRHENENIDHLNLPDTQVLERKHVLTSGKTLSDTELNKINVGNKPPIICAKEVFNNSTKSYSYYILCAGGQMFDPTKIDVRYKSRNNWKHRRVNKSTYNLYMQFLNTKHKTYLYQAERSI